MTVGELGRDLPRDFVRPLAVDFPPTRYADRQPGLAIVECLQRGVAAAWMWPLKVLSVAECDPSHGFAAADREGGLNILARGSDWLRGHRLFNSSLRRGGNDIICFQLQRPVQKENSARWRAVVLR